jgi:uncharacterized protein (TIGR02453 family)
VFDGWPQDALDFYDGLEADNSRAYWTAHLPVYKSHVLGPMTDLMDELAPVYGKVKIFRPYRDLRFSKDKSPYKTMISAMFGDGYIELSARGLAAGYGMYEMASDQLERYRQAVADDKSGAELERLVAAIRSQDIEVQAQDTLMKAPRGYPADHPRIDLLRYKGLMAWKQWPVEPWLGTAAAKDRVTAFMTAAQPLRDWLAANVGPSAEPESRRP